MVGINEIKVYFLVAIFFMPGFVSCNHGENKENSVSKIGVKVATIANRAREGTQATAELGEYLEQLKVPNGRKLPFLAHLRSSVNYLRAAERGLSIFEFAPMATQLDRECWAPVTKWLASARSLPE